MENFSEPPIPLPPATMISASVRSGRLLSADTISFIMVRKSLGDNSISTSVIFGETGFSVIENVLGLNEITAGLFEKEIFATAFPEYTGLWQMISPSLISIFVQSDAALTPSRAATDGIRSFPIEENGNRTTSGFWFFIIEETTRE